MGDSEGGGVGDGVGGVLEGVDYLGGCLGVGKWIY